MYIAGKYIIYLYKL